MPEQADPRLFTLYDLSGKSAIVTGTTSGLGWRFAILLARAGAKVALTGRRSERLEELCRDIEAFDGRALPIRLDVRDVDSIRACVDEAETELGPIDILVNNAGMNRQGRAIDMSEEDYDAVLDTNLKGYFFMATEVARRMIDRAKSDPEWRGGRILNLASIGSHSLLPGLTLYNVSKAGVAMMTRALAREWARYDINVNALCPGYIETELNSDWFRSDKGKEQIESFTRKRLMEPDDLDGMFLLLCSEQGRHVTGSVLTLDDGQTLSGMK